MTVADVNGPTINRLPSLDQVIERALRASQKLCIQYKDATPEFAEKLELETHASLDYLAAFSSDSCVAMMRIGAVGKAFVCHALATEIHLTQ